MRHDLDEVTYRYLRRFHLYIVDPGTLAWASVRFGIALQRLSHAYRPVLRPLVRPFLTLIRAVRAR